MSEKKKYKRHRNGNEKPTFHVELTPLQKSKLPVGRLMAVFMWDDDKAVEYYDRNDPYIWDSKNQMWYPLTATKSQANMHLHKKSQVA